MLLMNEYVGSKDLKIKKLKFCFEGIYNSRLHGGQRSRHRSKDPANQHLGRNSGLELKTSTTTTTIILTIIILITTTKTSPS
jgi:hypothetical protein